MFDEKVENNSTTILVEFLFQEVKDYIDNGYKCTLYQQTCIYNDIEDLISSFQNMSDDDILQEISSIQRDALIAIVKKHRDHQKEYYRCQSGS